MEIRTIVNSLVDLFFPMRCIHCNYVIDTTQILCVSCVTDLPYTHWNLDQKNKAFKQLYQYCRVEGAYSLLHFTKENCTQSILHEMKYKSRPEPGIDLADLVSIDLSRFDYIIPIPLHRKRLKERGYNQVEPFTKAIAKKYNIPYADSILIRSEYKKSQVFKNKEERVKDLSSVFKIIDSTISGHILIVDDLITTGATLSQAVRVFNQLNDVKVSVLTIACD
jgi:competence protein ComFC